MAAPAANQPSLFAAEPQLPEGMVYRPDFIAPQQEAALAGWLATLPFEAFPFRGYEGRRQVVSFGWRYDFNRSHLQRADDLPCEIAPLRARAADLAGLSADRLEQVLINKYQPGAPIGWHRDRPVFDTVVGVSLLAPCAFRLRRRVGAGFERKALVLAPRSAYVLAGAARNEWEHSIPPVAALRYSITFRSFHRHLRPADH